MLNLSTKELIDELAKRNIAGEEEKALTGSNDADSQTALSSFKGMTYREILHEQCLMLADWNKRRIKFHNEAEQIRKNVETILKVCSDIVTLRLR